MAATIEPLQTIEDLDLCPDDGNRYELIGGRILVSRAPGIPHQRVLNNLQYEFESHLRQNPIGIMVPGVGAIFSKHDAVIPDLVFVLNEHWEKVTTGTALKGPPDLAIEILSPGTENRHRDLILKRDLYAQYGVAEYWLIDPRNRTVNIYRLAGTKYDAPLTLADGDQITSPLLPGFQPGVSDILLP
jgi:Uma2 family endonuclease